MTLNKKIMICLAASTMASWSLPAAAVPLTGGTPHSAPLSTQKGTCTGTPCTTTADESSPASNDAAKAFDQQGTTYWMAGGVQKVMCGETYSCSYTGHLYWHTDGILGYTLPRPILVYQYEILPPAGIGYAPKSWTFEGYSPATGWKVLDKISNYYSFTAGVKSLFPIATPAAYSDYRLRVTANAGGDQLQVAELTLQGLPLGADFDVDGDRKSERAVFRPSTGEWILTPHDPRIRTSPPPVLGQPGDVMVPADYNGDGKTDLAIWRPSTGQWIVIYSNENFNNLTHVTLGTLGVSTDIPMPGDYDGDGKADLAVYRPSTSEWIQVWSSRHYAANQKVTKQFGTPGDQPVSGDFDGDGKMDTAVWSPTQQCFNVFYSKTATTSTISFPGTGGTAIPVPGDYDGDGKTDFSLFQAEAGWWYIAESSTGSVSREGFGPNAGLPVPADYDGDGKADVALWKQDSGQWTVHYSTTHTDVTVTQGIAGDRPLPAAFIHSTYLH